MTINPDALAISARGVRKSFGEHAVLDDVDLTVAEGTIFALLGPNGAGKTTMVRILSTLIRADAGEVRVGRARRGHRPGRGARRDRSHRPVLGGGRPAHRRGEPAADGRPAPSRPRRRTAGGSPSCSSGSTWPTRASKPVSTYSGGMRRRLDLAMTLVGDPAVIFLDEPTTGLDPRSRRTMWEIIRELVADGVTIFLTTQYLDEADQLADRIAVLDHGRIVAEGTPAELKRRIPGGHVRLQFTEPQALRSAAAVLATASPDDGPADSCRCQGDGTVASLRRLLDELGRRQHRGRAAVDPHPRPRRRVLRRHRPHRRTRSRRGGAAAMSALAYTVTDSATHAAPQPQTPAALPVADADAGRACRSCSCCCSSTSSAASSAPAQRQRSCRHGGRGAYLNYVAPGILHHDRRRRRAGHRDRRSRWT